MSDWAPPTKPSDSDTAHQSSIMQIETTESLQPLNTETMTLTWSELRFFASDSDTITSDVDSIASDVAVWGSADEYSDTEEAGTMRRRR